MDTEVKYPNATGFLETLRTALNGTLVIDERPAEPYPVMYLAVQEEDHKVIYMAPAPRSMNSVQYMFFISTVRDLMNLRAGIGNMSWTEAKPS